MPKITITTPEGDAFGAYAAMPTSGNGPVVVVIQEIFGVNANMRAVCDWLAGLGYIAVCPDLFYRQAAGIELNDKSDYDMNRAMDLYNHFDVQAGLRDLLVTLSHVRQMPGCNGKIGAVGYCLGGKLAYLLATQSDIDCVVGYYAVGLENFLGEVAGIRQPILLHIAEQDRFVSTEQREKVLQAMENNLVIQTAVYEGVDHAFARVGGQNFDATAAELANARTQKFLAMYL